MKRSQTDKAPGPDGITNRVLQECAESLKTMLTPKFVPALMMHMNPAPTNALIL